MFESEWREIDQQLRRIARRKGELDAEELMWLARAERVELHRMLGMASMVEYVERVLGYGPKTGKERLRVARKLAELPRMAAALERGLLPFSAVKELSRFVVGRTEEEWLGVACGKSLREIEEMASGRREGDRPGDPVDPDERLRPITMDVAPPTLGLLRDARRRLEEELGHVVTDDELVAIMCASVLAPRGADEVGTRVAPYQVALTVCEYCDRAWQDATGKAIAVLPSVLQQARCDAQYIGNVEGGELVRAYQEIPPAVARAVLRRDCGRCQVPGCRSSRWIQIHHIVPREEGGSNEPCNLVCLCSAHHQAHHRKQITIGGVAPDGLVFDLSRWPLLS